MCEIFGKNEEMWERMLKNLWQAVFTCIRDWFMRFMWWGCYVNTEQRP